MDKKKYRITFYSDTHRTLPFQMHTYTTVCVYLWASNADVAIETAKRLDNILALDNITKIEAETRI